MDADAGDMLDDARADLDETLSDGLELGLGERGLVCGMAERTACIGQKAAVCSTRRT